MQETDQKLAHEGSFLFPFSRIMGLWLLLGSASPIQRTPHLNDTAGPASAAVLLDAWVEVGPAFFCCRMEFGPSALKPSFYTYICNHRLESFRGKLDLDLNLSNRSPDSSGSCASISERRTKIN